MRESVVGEVGLCAFGGVRSRVVLLPDERLAAEEALDGRQELVLEELAVDGAVDVAVDDERADEAPPGDGPVHMYGGGMAVVADGLGLFAVQCPLPVVPRVVLEFAADEGGVGAHEAAVPVLREAVDHVAVLLAEVEVARLERDSARSRLEDGHFSQIPADCSGVDVLFVGNGS